MSEDHIGGVVLDVAAVVGICRRDPYPEAVWWATVHTDDVVIIPAAVLAEARASIPPTGLDILAVILHAPQNLVAVLDNAAAERIGTLLQRHPVKLRPLLSAAHAVLEATSRGWPLTTDRADLIRTLDPTALLDEMP